MAAAEEIKINESSAVVGSILYIFGSVLLITIVSVHCFKVYQDLFTKERKSVSHRRVPPQKTRTYRWIAICTLLSTISYTLSMVLSGISYVSTADATCDILVKSLFVFIQMAKTFMYSVFLIRLYSIYQTSAYCYPLKCINFFAVILIGFGVIVMIGLAIITDSTYVDYGDNSLTNDDPAFPNWCGPAATETYAILGGLIFIQDIAVAIGFLWAFLIPLRKTINAVKNSTHKNIDQDKIERKILYAGTKTTILTAVSTLSSVVILILIIVTGAGMLYVPDPFCNILSMIFMTPYYKDSVFYQKLCCCCIACCSSKSVTDDNNTNQLSQNLTSANNNDDDDETRTVIDMSKTQNTVNTDTATTANTASVMPPSVDTMSQLRVVGNNLKTTHDINHSNDYANPSGGNDDQEMVEVTPEPKPNANNPNDNDNDDNKEEEEQNEELNEVNLEDNENE